MRMVLLLGLMLLGFGTVPAVSSQPEQTDAAARATIAVGDIEAVFVDNGAFGQPRAGYNGIASLTHKEEPSTIFVPAYAGFNLEHIFGGEMVMKFEPRQHPMTLEKVSDHTVVLHQSRTPISAVESTTRFTVKAPHYIDIEFECIPHTLDFFKYGYIGLFWASYIHEPEDKSIHFLGRDESSDELRWIAAFSKAHGDKSTHRHINDRMNLAFPPDSQPLLVSDYSDYRFAEPIYYGRFRDMVFAYMWDRSEGVRFAQSPTGGGAKNPAWDFQFIVPEPKAGQRYGFRARLVYKPFVSADDVLAEYRSWKASLSGK
jgi:hypothetical protein